MIYRRPGATYVCSLPEGEQFVAMCVHMDRIYVATGRCVYRLERCWYWPWRFRLAHVC